jgi:hypothetical protein
MASGDLLCVFRPGNNEPPATAFATDGVRGVRRVLEFDAATNQAACFVGLMPDQYSDATGVDVTIKCMGDDNNAAHAAYFNVYFEKLNTDLDADSYDDATADYGNPNGTAGIPWDVKVVVPKANMDGVVAGDAFRLKIERDADNESDDVTGDVQVFLVEVRET